MSRGFWLGFFGTLGWRHPLLGLLVLPWVRRRYR